MFDYFTLFFITIFCKTSPQRISRKSPPWKFPQAINQEAIIRPGRKATQRTPLVCPPRSTKLLWEIAHAVKINIVTVPQGRETCGGIKKTTHGNNDHCWNQVKMMAFVSKTRKILCWHVIFFNVWWEHKHLPLNTQMPWNLDLLMF